MTDRQVIWLMYRDYMANGNLSNDTLEQLEPINFWGK